MHGRSITKKEWRSLPILFERRLLLHRDDIESNDGVYTHPNTFSVKFSANDNVTHNISVTHNNSRCRNYIANFTPGDTGGWPSTFILVWDGTSRFSSEESILFILSLVSVRWLIVSTFHSSGLGRRKWEMPPALHHGKWHWLSRYMILAFDFARIFIFCRR